ncbi:two pore domain potassium channel family protein [Halobacillus locisalis]|uniref:Two pore domain potassium channel family protein n=1 Tax=Halobacillus locisalis TaxID=220753 RepID=A0A838CXK0_9BACI|nr:potassium channel family protein [Halobacillus locisalis]MBA2176559.1 two pore domain potassium channel family protein [Halobacillus locisalis]
MLMVIVSALCLALIAGALRHMFTSLEFEHQIFSFQLFISLLLLYTIVLIGFGIIYFVLIEQGVTVYQESLNDRPLDWMHEMARSIYFSGVTLFTVGYGDMIPVGVGRWIALVEAMIGYTLPAALVAKVWQSYKEDH